MTGKSPSELIFCFKPKTLLDLVNSKKKQTIDEDKRHINELNIENSFKKENSKFKVDQNVMYHSHFKNFVKWLPARVVKVISKFTYLIKVFDNVRFVHENQIKKSTLSDHYHNPSTPIFLRNEGRNDDKEIGNKDSDKKEEIIIENSKKFNKNNDKEVVGVRRPQRERKKVVRFGIDD